MSGKQMQLPDSHAHIINFTASQWIYTYAFVYTYIFICICLKASRCEIEIGPFH